MKYYNADEGVNKIPYDKEPIHRQSSYNKKSKSSSMGGGNKLLSLVVCALVVISVVFGFSLLKLSKERPKGTQTNIVNINSNGTMDVSAVSSSAKLSVVCVHAGVTTESTESPDYQGFFNMKSKGAGVIFRDNKNSGEAYIVTCFHVVKGFSSQIYVLLYDSFTPQKASLVYYSSIYDVAVIKLTASSEYTKSYSRPAEIADSSLVLEGDGAVAIGNPLGAGFSVTSGIVSKITDLVDVDGVVNRVMRTDAPINGGNSGGGLFDSNGKLIGLVNAKATDNASQGSYIDCVAYAIPSNVVISIAENIVRNKMPVKAVLGITLMVDSSGVSLDIIAGKYVPVQTVVVSQTGTNSLFKMNDKIIGFAYDDKVVNMINLYTFDDHAFNIDKGDTVKFFVERDGKQITIDMTISEVISADYQDWYEN